jgi:hypothetical protein
MTCGAIGGEDLLAGVHIAGLCRLRDGWIGERAHEGHHLVNIGRLKDLIMAKGRHLRGAAVGMRRVDADADGLGNGVRVAAPQP